jgi:fructose-bisphosphate aldolase class II
MTTRDAVLDIELIGKIHAAVTVPLVLHGSSGVPDHALQEAVRAGLTKINIATQLNKVFTAAVRSHLASDVKVTDPRRYVSAGRDAIATEVCRLINLLSGSCT